MHAYFWFNKPLQYIENIIRKLKEYLPSKKNPHYYIKKGPQSQSIEISLETIKRRCNIIEILNEILLHSTF